MLPIDGYCVPGPVRRFIFAVARPPDASALFANKRANVAIDDTIINLIISPDMYSVEMTIYSNSYFYFKYLMNIPS